MDRLGASLSYSETLKQRLFTIQQLNNSSTVFVAIVTLIKFFPVYVSQDLFLFFHAFVGHYFLFLFKLEAAKSGIVR